MIMSVQLHKNNEDVINNKMIVSNTDSTKYMQRKMK